MKDAQAAAMSDNEPAQRLNDARTILFKLSTDRKERLITLKNRLDLTHSSIGVYCGVVVVCA